MEYVYLYSLISVLASLLWVYISFRYFLYNRGRIYNGLGNQDKYRRLTRWSQVSLLVSSLAFIGLFVNLFNLSKTALTPPASATLAPGEGAELSIPEVSQPSPTASAPSPLVLTLSVESSPTPGVIPGSGFALIGNTNNFGVMVRAEPGLKYEVLTQLSDGNRVELIGEAQSADGFTWQHVRLEDGRLGWIAENFIIPEP